MVPAAAVIDIARTYRETPFRHQGRRPGVGLDCVGMLVCAFRAAGLRVPDRRGYGRQPDPAMMAGGLSEALVRHPRTRPWQPADVLWMQFDAPQHLALYTGRSIIHAYAQVGRVVEHRVDPLWVSRVVSVWRHPEVSHG